MTIIYTFRENRRALPIPSLNLTLCIHICMHEDQINVQFTLHIPRKQSKKYFSIMSIILFYFFQKKNHSN